MSKNLAKQAKTHRAKRAMKAREPKLVEDVKEALFIRGKSSSQVVNGLMEDLYLLKKPSAKQFSRKNDFLPFEDMSNIEFLSNKNDAALFAFGSHNKKRPHSLLFGRTHSYELLDMAEVGVINVQRMGDFSGRKPQLPCKPCFVFEGEEFDTNPEFAQMRNLLLDFFRGQVVTKINLQGVDTVIVVTAAGGVLRWRTYVISLKRRLPTDEDEEDEEGEGEEERPAINPKMPRVHLVDCGPNFDMVMRRTRWASQELMASALRRPKNRADKPKAEKNVHTDGEGNRIAKLRLEHQDLRQLVTRKTRALGGKRSKGAEGGSSKK